MIAIKPHHLIDILTSFGEGITEFTPHPYGHAVHTVAREVLDHPGTMLVMELGADDICKPCQHNIRGICDDTIDPAVYPKAPRSKRVWNLLFDQRWCDRLNIKAGDRMTAREFCERLQNHTENPAAIYLENPADEIARREVNLRKGIQKFLEK